VEGWLCKAINYHILKAFRVALIDDPLLGRAVPQERNGWSIRTFPDVAITFINKEATFDLVSMKPSGILCDVRFPA
jgi:hypothetical protein